MPDANMDAGGVCSTQGFGYYLGIYASNQTKGRISMPQPLEPQVGQVVPPDDADKVLGYLIGAERRAVGMGKDESRVLPQRAKRWSPSGANNSHSN